MEKFKSDSSTTHKGDTNINFTGNNNTLAIGQSQGQAEIDQSKEINQTAVLFPRNHENFFLIFGEKLLKIVSGSLENGIYKVIYIYIIVYNIIKHFYGYLYLYYFVKYIFINLRSFYSYTYYCDFWYCD